jgi:hypothetical protein
MIDEYAPDEPAGPGAIGDVALITGILQQAAREGHALSYSELLQMLGFRFTRPKMRTLCKTLDVIDTLNATCGEPELAALVVREGDGLPGQGWWTGRRDYGGAWTGPDARAYLDNVQARAFRHWSLAKRRG